MESDDQETMDLPMMSNRDISLVDHYILDLSCDMKNKCFTGSITLFMQPAPTNFILHSENKTPHAASSNAPDSQGMHLSETKKLSTSESSSSLVNSKIGGTAVSDPKVYIDNKIINTETDMGHLSKCGPNKCEELLTTPKNILNPSVHITNVNLPVPTDLILPSEDKTPCAASSSAPDSQGMHLSEAKKLPASESSPSLVTSKIGGIPISDPEVNVSDQQISYPETNVGHLSRGGPKNLSASESSSSLVNLKIGGTPISDPKVNVTDQQISNPEKDVGHLSKSGPKKLSMSESSPSLVTSKIDNTTVSDLKVNINNSQLINTEIDEGHLSKSGPNEFKDLLTTPKDIQNPSVHITNVNMSVLSIRDQKINEFVPSRKNFKTDLHPQSLCDDKLSTDIAAKTELTIDVKRPLVEEAMSSSPSRNLKTEIPPEDPQLNECTGKFQWTPGKKHKEETSEKVRISERKRKMSDSPVDSEELNLPEKVFLSNKAYGAKDVPIMVRHHTFPILDTSNPKSETPLTCSSHTGLSVNDQPFVLILDMCDIQISQVKLLELPNCEVCSKPCLSCRTKNKTHAEREKFLQFCSLQPGQNLHFSTTKWALNIWDERQGMFDARVPFVVKIEYSTLPEGKSLKWVTDQDANMTVFTRGDFINNRSLFPSQDHPETLSTWQAYITVAEPNNVLMTGDTEAVVTQQQNGLVQFYYQSSMLMPSSTVAVAIGQWQCLTIFKSEFPQTQNKTERWIPDFCSQMHNTCSVNFSQQAVLPCRVFTPTSLMPRAEAEFQHYLPKCLAEIHTVLGPHPFCRLDVLIVPSCFESLGMANPCLIFLSESVLVGNCSFCCRLSHEVSHSWFGLVMGPKDWTEEWMTEGFASFIEDVVHPKVMGMSEKEGEDWFELRALLKYRVLTAELSHTDEELQIMRINESDVVADRTDKNSSVKNGLNPDKKCLQVHYLKGYFLLQFFSQKVGMSRFQIFLRKYVHHFHGQLVTSQGFLQMLFKEFPGLREENLDEKQICEEWLDKPGLPKALQNLRPNKQVKLISDVYQQLEAIRWGLVSLSQWKLEPVCEDQLTLLLDLLLDVPCGKSVLEKIYHKFHISKSNPDVRHRWCELVVKHKFTKFYKDVKHFLLHDQAMGIYLFGELMLSNSSKQKQLAEECFHLLKDNMDDRLKKSVEEIIYGQETLE